jgi:hypothetical protein
MIKSASNETTDKLVDELVKNELLRFTVQFFKKTAEGLRPFGSGVLVQLHGVHFIFTASHVADHLEQKDNDLHIRVSHKSYINVLGEIKSTVIEKSQGLDMAYIKLDKQMLPPLSKPYRFLGIDKISKHLLNLQGMNYCVLGFPETNVKFDSGQMETGATFYLTSSTNEKPYEYYELPKENHHVLLMKGKGTDFTGERKEVNTHFYGISGCGLWLLLYYQDEETKEYSIDYRLIGIMTQFRKGKYFCLIGDKIHRILEAVEKIEGMKFREVPRQF